MAMLSWQHKPELADMPWPIGTPPELAHARLKSAAISAMISFVLCLAVRYASNTHRRARAFPAAFAHLLLSLDLAIESPLILAFHPSTIASARNPFRLADTPGIVQIGLQVYVCYITEGILERWMMQLPVVFPGEDPAFTLLRDFVRPRATMIIAVALLGVTSPLSDVAGRFHAVAMTVWILVQQLGHRLA